MDEELVFKALADAHRRALLDSLRDRDGKTLGQLSEPLPMTRYGVMRHLSVLEEAGLITTVRVGREKHHFLNPVPIQMVYEQWVSRYARPWAGALTALRSYMEEEPPMGRHVQMVFIRAKVKAVWQALTDPAITPSYYFGSAVEANWKVGGSYRYPNPSGGAYIEGRILEIEPPHRLVQTLTPKWEGSEAAADTRVTWLLEQDRDLTKVTLTHEGIDAEQGIGADLAEGWARILSGLKTVLETAEHTG